MRKSTIFGLTAGMLFTFAGSAFADEVAYTLNPASGSVVTDLMTVSVEFPDNRNVAFYENNPMSIAVLENTTTGKVYNCNEADRDTFAETEGIVYSLTFIGEDEEEAMAITEPGLYTLTIRAMYLDNGEEDSVDLPVINAEYTINYPVAYVLDPAAGENVSNLKTVTIEFPDTRNVEFYENSPMSVAVLENVTTGKVYNCVEADRVVRAESEGIVYSLTFIGEDEEEAMDITEPGDYRLTIRAMYLNNGDEENVDLPVITANYTVAYPVAYTLTPEDGSVVSDLMTISIEFPEVKNVEFYENNPMPVAVLENLATGKVYNCNEADRVVRAESEGIVYNLTFIGEDEEEAAAITEPGNYLLTIRAMYLNEEGGEVVDLPVITANYTVAYPVAYDLNPVNGASVLNLKTVSIEFPEVKNVEFYENNPMPVAVLENTTTGKVYSCAEADRVVRAESEGIVYSLTFIGEDDEEAMDITEPGKYELTIRALYLSSEDGENVDLPVITANYTIEYPVAYYLNPDNGANVADLMTVSIEFPENNNVEFYENSPMSVAVLENVTTGKVYNCNEADRMVRAETEGIVYSFTFIGEDEEEAMPITEPGKYQLTIRAMFLNNEALEDVDNVDLPVINAEYTIEYPVVYYLNPDNGANVADLKTVSIEFPENNNVEFYENNQMPVAVLENTTTGKVYNCVEADRMVRAETEGIVYSFTFIGEDEEEAMPITEPGKYQLTIRAMFLNNEALEDVENVDLPVITAEYTIEYPVVYYLNPDNGAYVEDLQTVSIEFPENNNVDFYENNQMPVAVLENTTTGKVYNCQEADRMVRAETEGIVYSFTFIGEDEEEAMPITEPGKYQLTIRALYLNNEELEDVENVDLPVITAEYTIAYPYTYILTPEDGADVEMIEEIGLEFPNNTNIGFYSNMQIPVAVLTELNTGTEYICSEADRNTFAETEGVAYSLKFMNFETESFDPIAVPGTYKLVIRALAVLDEEGEAIEDLPNIEATYTVGLSGVKAVECIDEAKTYTIHGFNGITIVRNGSADDVKNLPAGMYIINGKKVILR